MASIQCFIMHQTLFEVSATQISLRYKGHCNVMSYQHTIPSERHTYCIGIPYKHSITNTCQQNTMLQDSENCFQIKVIPTRAVFAWKFINKLFHQEVNSVAIKCHHRHISKIFTKKYHMSSGGEHFVKQCHKHTVIPGRKYYCNDMPLWCSGYTTHLGIDPGLRL